uniref:transposase n=2 Tax=Nocardia TaxID=1817 RepID=UPI000687A587
MFSGLSALVIDEVVEEGWKLVVRARTAPGPAVCSRCGEESEKVHSYHHRTVADLPADGRVVIVRVRVRRLVCPTPQCCRTFREQVPGLLERYQRRTTRLTGQVRAIVKELAGRAAVRVLAALPVRLSRHTAVRILLAIPLPHRPVPQVVSVYDFALRRRNHYGTAVIDAVTHQRIDVLADRKSETLSGRRAHLDELVGACPEMTDLARLVGEFAAILIERRGGDLDEWMKQVREAGLTELGPFLRGLDQDHDAAVAGLTVPYSNGPIEGVNTKTKLIKRQMYGRASFPLLRHRILLA